MGELQRHTLRRPEREQTPSVSVILSGVPGAREAAAAPPRAEAMAARLASEDAAVGDPAAAAPSSSSAAGRDLVRAAALEAGEPKAALKLRRPPAALRRHLHLPPGGTSIPTRQHLPPSLPLPRRRACGTATRAQHGSTVELSPAPLPSSPLRGGGQIRTLPQRRASRRRRGRRRRRAGPPLQRRPSSPPSAASSRGALRSRSGLRGAAGRPRRRALARLGGSRGHGASSSSPLLPGQRPWRVLRDPAAGMAHGARRGGAARPRTGAHPPPHRRRGSVLAILPLPHLRSGPHSRPPIGSSAGPARASSATADARTRGGAWEGGGRRRGGGRRGGIGRGAEGRWFAAVAARRPRRGRRSVQPRPPHGGDRGSAVAGRGEGGGASSAWRGGRRDGGAHGRRRRRPGGSGLGHQRKGRKEGGDVSRV